MTGPLPVRSPSEPRRATVVVLLALACLPYLLGLGSPSLWDANEPLYAEPPREALETGEWLAPPWNYKPWFVRPPLASWAMMPAYALLGVGETGARLPGALAAVATVLATYALGRALGGRRTGLLAALVLASTARQWLFARQLAGDTWLTACLVGGFAGAVGTLAGRPGSARGLVLGHVAVAVGVLAKGPVILGLYAVPLLVAARWRRPRLPLSALRPGLLAILVLGIAGPWFAYMAQRFGLPYVRDFFGWHHVRRAISDDVGSRPWWYMLQAIAGEGQPWVVLLPFAAHRAWRAGTRDPATILAWTAALFPLVFFSIPMGKRSVYLMPGYPMMAVALAPFLAEAADGLHRTLVRGGAIAATLAAAAGTAFLVLAQDHVPGDLARASWPFLVGMPVAGVLVAIAAWRAHGRLLLGVLVGAPIYGVLASLVLMPVLGRYMPVPQLARVLVERAAPGDAAVVYGVSIHSLMFYARRPTVVAHNPKELLDEIPPGGRAFVLGQDDEVAVLPANVPVRLTEIARAPYFKFQFSANVLGRRPSTRDLVLVIAERIAGPPGEAPGRGVR